MKAVILFLSISLKLVTAMIERATLASTIEVSAACACECARRRRAPAGDCSANACAERCAAGDSSYGACASFEMTTRRAPVKSIEPCAASAYGRALLTTDEPADGSASEDHGGRARLASEARAPATILRRSHRSNRRGEDYEAQK
jgi:hypothetical protein